MTSGDTSGIGFFCWNCGAKTIKGNSTCPSCNSKYVAKGRYGNTQALGAGGVGWSDRYNDPFFRKYAGKYVKITLVWMLVLSIIIPAILLITNQIEPEGEGLIVMLVVPAVIWLVGILFLLKKYSGSRDKSWDGIVENKTEQQKTRTEKRGKTDCNRTIKYMEYVVVIRRQDGSEKRLTRQDDASDYRYFNIGEHVRFHDSKYLKFLEKYDKSRDTELTCPACHHRNDARDNYCLYCGAPMFKGRLDVPPAGNAPIYAAPTMSEVPFVRTIQSNPTAPVYCSACGQKLTGGGFCENCGVRVD